MKQDRICSRPPGTLGLFARSPGPAVAALVLGGPLLLSTGRAHAGGYELPGNGTEALGRGGAFTAKADTPLALEYNVAGLAQQRGTRLLFDNNLYFGDYSFQRTGMEPGSSAPYALATDVAHSRSSA